MILKVSTVTETV